MALLTSAAMLAATLMIAQHIAGKATRDTLFLTAFDINHLPMMMMVAAAVSVGSVLMMSRLLARYGPARLMPPFYLGSAALLGMQWYLSDIYPQVAAVALYIHISAINSILISGFWSTINERFDPYTTKKLITRLTAATTFGGLIGGLATKTVASMFDTHTVLLMLGAMHIGCGAAIGYFARGQEHVAQGQEGATGLLTPLKRNPLIRRMALLALLVATTDALLDYLLKAQAASTLTDDQLISFFSYFYMAVGLGTFLVQMAVGNRALRWLGLGGTMAAWPLAIIATGGTALIARSLVTVTLMRASANLLYNSFFRAGFELLYTPITPADKRTGKVLIDVGADRSGDMLGGLLIMLILLLPGGESPLFVTAMILSVVGLLLVLLLHRGYVRQLADNLRSGEQQAGELDVVDATTAQTVATTQAIIDRDKLLQQIAQMRSTDAETGVQAGLSSAVVDAESVDRQEVGLNDVDAVASAIIALRSRDEERMRRVLAGHGMSAELLPHVVPLLADERVLGDALRAMRKLASPAAGQLVDALINPMQHALVKRRLPLVLAHSDSPLAVQGLTQGLADPDWDVRYRCAEGLENIRRNHPHLRSNETRLLSMAEREAHTLSRAKGLLDALVLGATQPGGQAGDDVRRLHLLFLLFGILYEPEPIDLALRALQSGDLALQGTALEYLENRIPAHIWSLLQPALAPGRTGKGRKRSLQQSAKDLLAAAATLRPTRKPAPAAIDPAIPGRNGRDKDLQ